MQTYLSEAQLRESEMRESKLSSSLSIALYKNRLLISKLFSFPEMRVTKKIFTRAAAIFFNQFNFSNEFYT